MAETQLDSIVHNIAKRHQLDLDRIDQALALAHDIYDGQEHWTGESVMDHVTGVLNVLLPIQPDEDAIIACILHHTLMPGGVSLTDLEQQFGPTVRSLVSGVHLLAHVTLRHRLVSIEDLRMMMMTVSDDLRTILITLCDRLHILQHLATTNSDDARRISQDVLQLFAPVAARLGIYNLKHALEDLAFPVLYPSDADNVNEQVTAMEKQHGKVLQNAAQAVQEKLLEQGLRCQVYGRQKQPYSVFTKMRNKSLTDLNDVYDFYALRVVVPTVEQCYQVLGMLHTMARPVPYRFKDYISFPKPNGYQSLHTTLMQVPGVPPDVMLEVQVRTEAMQREAEYGVAAHWSYKTYGSTAKALEQVQLSQVISSQELTEDETSQSLADHIFVLTPNGAVLELPEGATPLDFAFRLHTDLGLAFRGARVNGHMVPISYQLENGDVVEIMKHSKPQPSPEWLQMLRMSSARSKLKRYMYSQQRPELITRGRELINEQLIRLKQPTLDQDLSLLRVVDGQSLTVQQREDALMKVGQGSERASALMNRIDALKTIVSPPPAPKRPEAGAPTPVSQRVIKLEGNVPMPTRFAKCCKPEVDADPVLVGVINRAGIVVVHRKACGMLRNSNPERQVKAWWE